MAGLFSTVDTKIKLVCTECRYFIRKKFQAKCGKHCMVSSCCLQYNAREKIRNELLHNNKPELEDLNNSQPMHIARNKKLCPRENTKGAAVQLFAKSIK